MLFLDTNVFLYAVGRPHAATAKLHGIEKIVTADRHFDSIAGLQRIDPSAAANLPADAD